jgi:hypothetical protein
MLRTKSRPCTRYASALPLSYTPIPILFLFYVLWPSQHNLLLLVHIPRVPTSVLSGFVDFLKSAVIKGKLLEVIRGTLTQIWALPLSVYLPTYLPIIYCFWNRVSLSLSLSQLSIYLSIIFEIGSHYVAQTDLKSSYLSLLSVAITGVYHHARPDYLWITLCL